MLPFNITSATELGAVEFTMDVLGDFKESLGFQAQLLVKAGWNWSLPFRKAYIKALCGLDSRPDLS